MLPLQAPRLSRRQVIDVEGDRSNAFDVVIDGSPIQRLSMLVPSSRLKTSSSRQISSRPIASARDAVRPLSGSTATDMPSTMPRICPVVRQEDRCVAGCSH